MKNVLLLLALIACNKTNPNYCADHPDHNCNEAIDAREPDGTQSNCTIEPCVTGVCDTTSNTCVECTAAMPQACVGVSPVCGSDDMCRKCAAHSECGSAACLPDGSCAATSDVAYVDSTGTQNSTCSPTMTCTIAAALATGRSYVKLAGSLTEAVAITTGTVTFLSDPGTHLTTTTAGPVMSVSGTANVSIYDLDVHAGGSIGDGIDLPAGTPTLSLHHTTVENATNVGIYALAGTLVIDESTISLNTLGGLDLRTGFNIQNSFVTRNGFSPSAGFGGMQIITPGSTHRLEFTTIANNGGNASVVNGLTCTGIAAAITFTNNIIYGNINDTQVSGSNCVFTFSDIGPTTQSGNGNLDLAPMFVDSAGGNFHLMMGSPVKDQADPAATLPYDFDGNPRPQDVHDDMGADEIMP